jgi:hypothetical protein
MLLTTDGSDLLMQEVITTTHWGCALRRHRQCYCVFLTPDFFEKCHAPTKMWKGQKVSIRSLKYFQNSNTFKNLHAFEKSSKRNRFAKIGGCEKRSVLWTCSESSEICSSGRWGGGNPTRDRARHARPGWVGLTIMIIIIIVILKLLLMLLLVLILYYVIIWNF